MAFTNYETHEINAKVLYFGSPGSGKSENLRAIYRGTSRELHAGLLDMNTMDNGKYFFEFLPVSIGQVGKFHIKLHLFTLPPLDMYETVNSVLLKGLDAVVCVIDSRSSALPQNFEAMQNLEKTLQLESIQLLDLPRVYQYNHRDAKDAVDVGLLRREFNTVATADQEATAIDQLGTLETLQSVAKLVLGKLSDSQGSL